MALDAATWAALALTLTLLGGVYSYVAWHRRGPTAGLRGLAWALVPAALWASGTLKLAGNIAGDIAGWAVHLVFSPLVWLGVVLGGVAVVLFGVTGALQTRGIGTRHHEGEREPRAVRQKRKKVAPKDDDGIDDMDDIQAILRKHGIS